MMRTISWLICVLVATACTGQGKPMVTTEMLNQHNCQRVGAGVKQVQLKDLSAIRVTRTRMLIDPKDKQPDPTSTQANPIDTQRGANGGSNSMLVVVSRGQQPTPGYALSLAEAYVANGTVELQFNWQEPAADAVLPQMMTNPCIVIAMPKGDYARVRASDQRGEIGSLTLR